MDAIQRRSDSDVELFLQNWEQKKELAGTLLRSGFLPPAFKTPEQVIAVMLKGQELGIPAMEALNSINVVNGKPTVSPQLMLALARRSKELEDIKIEHTDDACIVTVKRKGQSPHTTRFGAREARALNLHHKDNYIKQAHTMYQWRALAANLRVTFPDMIGGLYTPEEMGAEVTITDDGAQIYVDQNMESTMSPMDTEISTEDNPELERSPDIEIQGNVFQTFNPDREKLTFGKYAGALWSEVPESYLQWLKGNATQREILDRVEATLRWRDMVSKKQEHQSASTEQDEALTPRTRKKKGADDEGNPELFDTLTGELRTIAGHQNSEELKLWAEQNMAKIESLSERQRSTLRREYKNAIERVRKENA